jgi:hypothetical protein
VSPHAGWAVHHLASLSQPMSLGSSLILLISLTLSRLAPKAKPAPVPSKVRVMRLANSWIIVSNSDLYPKLPFTCSTLHPEKPPLRSYSYIRLSRAPAIASHSTVKSSICSVKLGVFGIYYVLC